jgi:hypothetical protein
MWLIFRATIVLVLASVIISCSPKCIDIYPEDIPMYPNVQNIVQDEPIIDWRKTYTWNFTTTDTPEKVWQFYLDEMVPKWDGLETTFQHSPETTEINGIILKKCCYFTYLQMFYTLIDSTTYRITIQLVKEPRM